MAAEPPPRIRIISTPLGRFVDVELGGDSVLAPAAPCEETGPDTIDADFVVLDTDEPAAPRPLTAVDRIRSLGARLRREPDPYGEALSAALATVRARHRAASDE